MQTQGTLEYAIRDMLRGKLSDQLDRMGITERGVPVPSSESWFAVGLDAEGTDDDYHGGGMGTSVKSISFEDTFRTLAKEKSNLGDPVVRKSEIMAAADPAIKDAASRMAKGTRRSISQVIERARGGVLGLRAERAVSQSVVRERSAERHAYDLPAADANDPRGRADADSFFIYPEQDWDNLRDPVPGVRRPGTAAQARAVAIEGTRRVMTELKRTGDPIEAAAALDQMDMKAPPPGQPAVTAGEVARVEIEAGLAKQGISLPRKTESAKQTRSLLRRVGLWFRPIPAAKNWGGSVASAKAATVEGF